MVGAHYSSSKVKKNLKNTIIFCITIEAVEHNLGKELFQSCVWSGGW